MKYALSTLFCAYMLCGFLYCYLESLYPDDLRSFEIQKAEARLIAESGHLAILNREACKKLEPGDIVLFKKELWSVRVPTSQSVVRITNLDCDLGELRIHSNSDMARLEHIYRRDTPEWYRAAWILALQGLLKPVRNSR